MQNLRTHLLRWFLVSVGVLLSVFVFSQKNDKQIIPLDASKKNADGFDRYLKLLADFQRNSPKDYRWNAIVDFVIDYDQKGLFIRSDDILISPLAHYKSFPVSRFFQPDQLSFEVRHAAQNGAFSDSYLFEHVDLVDAKLPLCFIEDLKNEPSNTIEIRKVKAHYNEESFAKFKDYLAQINLLNTDKTSLEVHAYTIQNVSFAEDWKLQEDLDRLCEINYAVSLISTRSYYQKLALDTYDPYAFKSLLNNVEFRVKLLKGALFEKYNDLEIREMFSELLEGYIQRIYHLEEQEAYAEAYELIAVAKSLKEFIEIDADKQKLLDSLERKNSKALLDAYVAVADKAIERDVVALAENYIRLLDEWRQKLDVNYTDEYQQLVARLYNHVCEKADNLARAGQFALAEDHYFIADDIYQKYELPQYAKHAWKEGFYQGQYSEYQDEPDVEEGSLSVLYCAKRIEQFNQKIDKALIKKQASDFLGLRRILSDVVGDEYDMIACGYDGVLASELLSSVQHPLAYQEKLIAIDKLITEKKYDYAINEYFQAGNLYFTHSLKDAGLFFVSPLEFVESRRNADLEMALLSYLMGVGEYKVAIDLAMRMCDKNYKNDHFFEQIELLGARCAMQDSENGEEYHQALAKYSFQSEYINYFKKGFETMWNMN